MPENWKPVKLAAKVIGHISQGMYRTPAGAIKELISNAYDAGASYTKIHTGFPNFITFTCEDDGTGMEQEKFVQLMEGGIGDSDKHAGHGTQTGKNGRPIIGRLGVGLLSLAQICPRFHIASFHGPTRTAFEAEIKFPPYSRQEIDRAIELAEGNPRKVIPHGEYRLTETPYEQGKTGITVTTDSLRDTYRKTMSDLGRFANKRLRKSSRSYANFDEFIQAIANNQLSSLYFASPYDQFLFGLALASPIPYLESSPDPDRLETVLTRIPPLTALQQQLTDFDFRVEVDNIELRRPILLPSNKEHDQARDCTVPTSPNRLSFQLIDGSHTEEVGIDKYEIAVHKRTERFQLYYFEYKKKVNGYPLHFSGYIFLQTTRLFPKEYQGILIRLRHVAIGQYDVNLMTYPMAEGPRFSMLSAEVFVHEGLDDALKVDRDGFNTLDPQYIRLQAFVHSILHERIFPSSWEEEKTRNKSRRAAEERKVTSTFARRLSAATQEKFTKVEVVPKTREQRPEASVSLDRDSRAVRIYESHPDTRAILGKKKYHGLAARVIAAFEVANQEKSAEKRRDVFYKLIEDIFQ